MAPPSSGTPSLLDEYDTLIVYMDVRKIEKSALVVRDVKRDHHVVASFISKFSDGEYFRRERSISVILEGVTGGFAEQLRVAHKRHSGKIIIHGSNATKLSDNEEDLAALVRSTKPILVDGAHRLEALLSEEVSNIHGSIFPVRVLIRKDDTPISDFERLQLGAEENEASSHVIVMTVVAKLRYMISSLKSIRTLSPDRCSSQNKAPITRIKRSLAEHARIDPKDLQRVLTRYDTLRSMGGTQARKYCLVAVNILALDSDELIRQALHILSTITNLNYYASADVWRPVQKSVKLQLFVLFGLSMAFGKQQAGDTGSSQTLTRFANKRALAQPAFRQSKRRKRTKADELAGSQEARGCVAADRLIFLWEHVMNPFKEAGWESETEVLALKVAPDNTSMSPDRFLDEILENYVEQNAERLRLEDDTEWKRFVKSIFLHMKSEADKLRQKESSTTAPLSQLKPVVESEVNAPSRPRAQSDSEPHEVTNEDVCATPAGEQDQNLPWCRPHPPFGSKKILSPKQRKQLPPVLSTQKMDNESDADDFSDDESSADDNVNADANAEVDIEADSNMEKAPEVFDDYKPVENATKDGEGFVVTGRWSKGFTYKQGNVKNKGFTEGKATPTERATVEIAKNWRERAFLFDDSLCGHTKLDPEFEVEKYSGILSSVGENTFKFLDTVIPESGEERVTPKSTQMALRLLGFRPPHPAFLVLEESDIVIIKRFVVLSLTKTSKAFADAVAHAQDDKSKAMFAEGLSEACANAKRVKIDSAGFVILDRVFSESAERVKGVFGDIKNAYPNARNSYESILLSVNAFFQHFENLFPSRSILLNLTCEAQTRLAKTWCNIRSDENGASPRIDATTHFMTVSSATNRSLEDLCTAEDDPKPELLLGRVVMDVAIAVAAWLLRLQYPEFHSEKRMMMIDIHPHLCCTDSGGRVLATGPKQEDQGSHCDMYHDSGSLTLEKGSLPCPGYSSMITSCTTPLWVLPGSHRYVFHGKEELSKLGQAQHMMRIGIRPGSILLIRSDFIHAGAGGRSSIQEPRFRYHTYLVRENIAHADGICDRMATFKHDPATRDKAMENKEHYFEADYS